MGGHEIRRLLTWGQGGGVQNGQKRAYVIKVHPFHWLVIIINTLRTSQVASYPRERLRELLCGPAGLVPHGRSLGPRAPRLATAPRRLAKPRRRPPSALSARCSKLRQPKQLTSLRAGPRQGQGMQSRMERCGVQAGCLLTRVHGAFQTPGIGHHYPYP